MGVCARKGEKSLILRMEHRKCRLFAWYVEFIHINVEIVNRCSESFDLYLQGLVVRKFRGVGVGNEDRKKELDI